MADDSTSPLTGLDGGVHDDGEAATEEPMPPPPAWANNKKSLGVSQGSTDSTGKRGLMRSQKVEEEDDVFDVDVNGGAEGLSQRASILWEPTAGNLQQRPKKKVRMASGDGPQRQGSLSGKTDRNRNPSGTSIRSVPSWANASFDIDHGHEPQGVQRKPYKRQQSCPVMFERSESMSPTPGGSSRLSRQMTCPESPPPVFSIDPPARRVRYRSGGRSESARSFNLSWANQSVDIGDLPSLPDEDDVKPTEDLINGAVTERVDEVAKGEVSDLEKQKLTGEDEEEGEEERAGWGGKMEFLFTCIGYAVGLGNVWRFPYLAYKNGGGAFLVPYIFMLAFVGLPLFFMELCVGQFASLGPISVWKINPLLKGLGLAMVCVDWLIAIYYNVIISHVMLFLFASFASIPTELPWIHCHNPWNSPDCITPEYDVDKGNTTLAAIGSVVNSTINTVSEVAYNYTRNATGVPRTPAEEYYNNFILEQSEGIDDMTSYTGAINWKLALCLLLSWGIVLICLIRGIQSLGKVVYFTAIFPYFMLTVLLIRGLTLPGAMKGIRFYLEPDFAKLADARVWCDAATQIFYSLSTGTGGLIAMSSYNKFDNNCYKDSLIVALINCATSIYSGFVIFSILGFMANEKGVEVGEVAAGGPGLAFVVYPEAISRMPVPVLWAIFFFFMMATLGFGSQFSIVECFLSAFTDEFPSLRGRWQSITYRTVVIIGMFFLGLPMVSQGGIYLLNLVDYCVSGFPLLIIGILEVAAFNWIYTYQRFSYDICLMLGRRPNWYWRICWCGLTPLIIGTTLLFNMIFYKPPSLDGYYYPAWANGLGWCITFFPVGLILIFFAYEYCKNGGFELLKERANPASDWGPALAHDRQDTVYDPTFDAEAHVMKAIEGAQDEENLKRPVGVVEPQKPILKNFPKSASDDDTLRESEELLPNSDASGDGVQTRVVAGGPKVRFGSEDESHV